MSCLRYIEENTGTHNDCNSEMCRLCAKVIPHDKLVELVDGTVMRRDINTKLERLNSAVDFDDEDLPATVCHQCCSSLQDAYMFVVTIDRARSVWSSMKLPSDKETCTTEVPIKKETREISNQLNYYISISPLPSDDDGYPSKQAKEENKATNISCLSRRDCNVEITPPSIKTQNEMNNSIKVEPGTKMSPLRKQSRVLIKNEVITAIAKAPDIKMTTSNKILSRKVFKVNEVIPTVNNEVMSQDLTIETASLIQTKESNAVLIQSAINRTESNPSPSTNSNCNSVTNILPPPMQVKRTWRDYSWRCSQCETLFPTCGELTAHSMQQHRRCNAYSCLDCNSKTSVLESFVKHVRKKHRNHFKQSCYKCFQPFYSRSQRLTHIAKHLTTKYTCRGCNTCFNTPEELKHHKSMFFKMGIIDDGLREFEGKFKGSTCLCCNKTYNSKNSLRYHLIVQSGCKSSFVCDKCGKGFPTKPTLKAHLPTHSNLKPFKCEVCLAKFKNKPELKLHVLSHDMEKRFSCETCGRKFRSLRLLRSHKFVHTDDKPFACGVCKKSFKTKPYLKQHMRQHTGEKPYYCEPCSRHFTYWSNYNQHMTTVHGKDMSKKKCMETDGFGKLATNITDSKLLEWMEKTLSTSSKT